MIYFEICIHSDPAIEQEVEQAVVKTYWSIGSNLGNREQHFARAMRSLTECEALELSGASSIYETEPVGYRQQAAFLNAAFELHTTLSAHALLGLAQNIEHRLGRERTQIWGPRSIDLDLLLYGDEQLRTEKLIVPHPRLHERKFVLVPLAELAPEQIVPGLNKPVRTLLEQCPDQSAVRRYRPVQISWDWTKTES